MSVKANGPVKAGARSQPGVSGLPAEEPVVPPAAFTSSVWGIHDSQDPLDPRALPTGCGYYRVTLPLDELGKHGWDVRYKAGKAPVEAGLSRLIVGERLDRPDVMGEWRRLRQHHRLVYELDDDVWSVDPANAQAYRTYGVHSVQDAVEMNMAYSDVVTASTEPLAEKIRRRTGHQRVRVIRNCIPEEMLSIERPRREHLIIGWGGGGSHARDVSTIAVPLRKAMDRDTSLRLHIVGTDFRDTLGHVHARHTKWLVDPHEYYRQLDFDIGLAPIYPCEFNESKSYLKPLEYAALGIPVIASAFGPYPEFVIDGVTGFLVKNSAQWTDRIRLLAADADLRESMGAKARELASQHTIEGNWHKWAAAYQEALS